MKKQSRDIIKGIAMITQIGLNILVTIFLCLWIGLKLDAHFHTNFWVLLFLFLGFAAAIRNVYHMTKSFYAKDKTKEENQLKYLEELKRERERKDKER